MALQYFYGTGRRRPHQRGCGCTWRDGFVVNGKPAEEFFPGRLTCTMPRNRWRPLRHWTSSGVCSGSRWRCYGQAGVFDCVARALLVFDPELRGASAGGFLTRDPRAKERKAWSQARP